MKNKSIIIGLVSAVFACNLVFTSCSEPKEVEKFTFLEKRSFGAEDSIIDQYPRTKGDAHGGSFFSRTDSTSQYGMGTVFNINDTTLNKDLRVNISFWARVNQIGEGYTYAVALHAGDKMVSWNTIDISKKIAQPNQWTLVTDSVTIPGNLINQPGLVLKTFSFNPNNPQKSIVFDVDDLDLSLKNVSKSVVE